jgi:hypothetical protein
VKTGNGRVGIRRRARHRDATPQLIHQRATSSRRAPFASLRIAAPRCFMSSDLTMFVYRATRHTSSHRQTASCNSNNTRHSLQRNSCRQTCGQHNHADLIKRQTELDVAAHALSSRLTRSTDTLLFPSRSFATIPPENDVHSNRKHTRRYVPSAIFWPATTSNGFRVDGRSA